MMIDPDHIGLLLLVNRLAQTQQPLGRATIVPFAEIKLPRVAENYDALARNLLDQQFAQGTIELFALTGEGAARAREIASTYSLHAWFYNAYYQAVLTSAAHAQFCARVYGKDLCQHGMTDMGQMDLLLRELRVQPGMTLLDFGCGDGRIAEYVSDTTQTQVVGIDIADQAIELANARTQDKRARLRFYAGNLEQQPGILRGEKFDGVYAMDSIFFARDQRRVLEIFATHLNANATLGIFYHCPPNVSADETPFAQAVQSLRWSYVTRDLSEPNAQHWKIKKQTLLELEPLFRAEGNLFLYKNRLAECDGLENFHRYLYLVAP